MKAKASIKRSTIIEIVVFSVILLAIVLAVIFTLHPKEVATKAHVYCQSETVYVLDLNEDKQVQVKTEHGIVQIEVKEGKIHVLSSPCPGQTCVHQGEKSQAGESIICAYEGVLISLYGETSGVGEITI